MQSTEIYSDSSCDLPVSFTIVPSENCVSTECTATTIAGVEGTYYMETECPTDINEQTEDFFEEFNYLLVNTYNDEDCNVQVKCAAYLASGKCEVAELTGQSVIVTVFSNGSTHLAYYLDASCTLPSSSYLIAPNDLASCTNSRSYFSSSDRPTPNSDYFVAPETSDDNDSKLSGWVIAGIVVGVVVVLLLLLLGALLFRRRQRKLKNELPSRANHLRDAYAAQVSPEKLRGQIASTIFTESDRSTSRIWDDDVVVGARIPREKIQLVELISRGGYGEVYLGSYHGHRVAVKMLLPEKKKTMSQVSAFLSEVKLMASLDHPRIVSFIGVAWDQLVDICVVSEYMAGGDLKALLTEFDIQKRPVGFDRTKVKIALHVSIALTYLHSCAPPVIHRDLKSKNILLDEAMNAKVTDFGISRERIDATMTGGIGTSFWMAPEVMMGEHYDDKADMFSFGVVLSELDSHVMPYALSKSSTSSTTSSEARKLPSAAILQMVAAGKLRAHFSDAGPQSMVELGLACVSLDPNDRPTAAEALYKLQQILANEV